MKIFGKAKASPKSNPKETEPEFEALMNRIAERLDALERKMDLVISQTSAGFFGGRERPRPVSQPFRHPSPSGRPGEVMPAQAHPQGSVRGRREKVMYKAVCADCKKDCEIPFQPTGERPVYCKECFSKRKAGNPVKVNDGNKQEPLPKVTEPSNSSQRQVSVTKKGVGKVTVSEIVQPSGHAASPKNKIRTPEMRSKRS
jgi:CxxC-x17-CxxC domain-containing protein